MLLHDPFALHRKWWDSEWKPSFGDDSWVHWDYVLANVFQVIEDYTDKNSGQWIPDDQSGDVWWDVQSSFSGSQAALDLARQNRELKPGESLYAVPVFDDSKPKPTLMSWVESMEEERADLRPSEHIGARPPTPEELAAMTAALDAKLEVDEL